MKYIIINLFIKLQSNNPIYINSNIYSTMQKSMTFLFLVLFSSFQLVSAQIYVDESAIGNNDGTSWTDAYVLLDSALVNAVDGDSIVVAEGDYIPHMGVDFDASGDTTRKEATFNIPSGVGVYGGFPSGGGERNINDNPTYLSGVSFMTISDTSYHVVYFREVSGSTRLDGFTIRFGRTGNIADPENPVINDSIGGGGILNAVYNSDASSDPVIANCTFTANYAFIGAGICNFVPNGGQANPVIDNCNFNANMAFIGSGLANFAMNEGIINSELIECQFVNNTGFQGAGMANIGMGGESSASLNNCTFRGNTASEDGGAITYNAGPGFTGNQAGTCDIVMTNCTFSGNNATGGGGISGYTDMDGTTSIQMEDCIFDGNTARDTDYASGGGFYASSDSAGATSITMKNCTFSNDSVIAPDWASGGGMKVSCDAFAEMIVDLDSCIFASNYATHAGGGFNMSADSTCTAELTMTNCEFIKNTARIYEGGGMVTSSHMSAVIVQELYKCTFEGNISGGNGGGLYIANERNEISPIIDSCEFSGNIASSEGGAMYNACWSKGSGQGGENMPVISNCKFFNDTSRNGDGGAIYNYYSDASVTNSLFRNNAGYSGGAVGNNHSNAVFDNCMIVGNHATTLRGGGISNYESSPQFTDCSISENNAEQSGGGMINNNSSPVIENCTISGNTAREEGGGIWNNTNNGESRPEIINTLISGNRASNGGGIISYATEGTTNPVLVNCVISGNYATYSGGGLYNQAGFNGYTEPVIANTTISGNMAGDEAGGVINRSNDGNCNPVFLNSIIWGNSQAGGQIMNENAIPSYAYSDVEGSGGSDDWKTSFGTNNGNNIDTLPHFVNMPDTADAPTLSGNLSLLAGSPCFDAGDPGTPDTLLTDYDIAGNIRIFHDIIDMGAYEYASFPEVIAAIEDVVVDEDAADSTVADLNEVFEDPEEGGALEFSVVANSNEDLLSATINSDDSTLVLSFNADSNGVAEIIVGAENQYSYMVTDTFTVTVNPVNDPPVAEDDTWEIPEDAENGDVAGTVVATDVDDESLTFSIQSGNDDGIFDIMAGTGTISVVDNTNLDYETTTSYTLEVLVSDGTDTDVATITVNITDVDETAIESSYANQQLILYPNPSGDFINVVTEHKGTFTVIDINGKKVTRLQSGKNDIRELEPGVYYIILSKENRDQSAIPFLKE